MEAAFPGTKNLELLPACTLRELDIGKRSEVGSAAGDAVSRRARRPRRPLPRLSLRGRRQGPSLFPATPNGPTALIDIGREADLFICEAYTRDKPVATHMALSSLEQHLGQIRPKRLILTHMSNDMLAHRAELPYETAEDGMIVEM